MEDNEHGSREKGNLLEHPDDTDIAALLADLYQRTKKMEDRLNQILSKDKSTDRGK